MISGSIEQQCKIRLENLFNESHEWLLKASFNLTKNREEAEDLTSELYEYLHTKQNHKLFYKDSYNLLYLHKFLTHRWINKTKRLNKIKYFEVIQTETPDDEYNVEKDEALDNAYREVMEEVQRLKKTNKFAPAFLFELYWCSEDTLQEVADKIGISKSTVFLSVKKVRAHLKKVITNPYET